MSSANVLLCASRMVDMQLSTTKRRVKEARNVRTVCSPALRLSSINARHDCKIHFTSAARSNDKTRRTTAVADGRIAASGRYHVSSSL